MPFQQRTERHFLFSTDMEIGPLQREVVRLRTVLEICCAHECFQVDFVKHPLDGSIFSEAWQTAGSQKFSKGAI